MNNLWEHHHHHKCICMVVLARLASTCTFIDWLVLPTLISADNEKDTFDIFAGIKLDTAGNCGMERTNHEWEQSKWHEVVCAYTDAFILHPLIVSSFETFLTRFRNRYRPTEMEDLIDPQAVEILPYLRLKCIRSDPVKIAGFANEKAINRPSMHVTKKSIWSY